MIKNVGGVRLTKVIIVFVLSIILFVIAVKLKSSLKKDDLKKENYKTTLAIIDRVIYSETGNVRYYVSFLDNGNIVTAQTNYYSSATKSLNTGDEVNIGYYFVKGKIPRAVIYDERVTPCSNSLSGLYKLLNVAGVLLLIIALFMLIRLI